MKGKPFFSYLVSPNKNGENRKYAEMMLQKPEKGWR
jgi:hypothetical protein